MSYLKRVILCILTVSIILSLIHYSNFDLKFQSLFFIQETKAWLIDKDNLELKFYLYRLPKILIISYGISMILWGSILWLCNMDAMLQKKLLFLVLALILTPLIVATFKHYSPIACPSSILEFGGNLRHISPLEIFDREVFFAYHGKCFPAGHASGGFALISLYFVFPSRKAKYSALFFALSMGCIMGLYQIAKGAHYLSDTIVTLSIAYLVSISLAAILLKENRDAIANKLTKNH